MPLPTTTTDSASRSRGRSTRLVALAAAAALSIVPLFAATPALAAEIPGAVFAVQVEGAAGETPIGRYERIVVTAQWAVPDNSNPGDTFTLGLPPQLEGLTDEFPLLDDAGESFGTCAVSAAQVLCTLSDLVESRPLDVSGSLFFSGRFTEQIVAGETNVLPFDTGLEVENVAVDVAAVEPYAGNEFQKSGRIESDGSVTWYVDLPHSVDGLESELTNVVITDTLDPALTFAEPGAVRLTTGTTLNADGSAPLYDQAVDPATYTVVITGQVATVTIPVLPAGQFYRLVIETLPVAGSAPSGSYENSATLTSDQTDGISNATAAVTLDAGGDAGGVAPGVAPGVTPGVGAGGGTAPGVTPRPELAATGAPTAGTFGLGALALLSLASGVALLTLRRRAETR